MTVLKGKIVGFVATPAARRWSALTIYLAFSGTAVAQTAPAVQTLPEVTVDAPKAIPAKPTGAKPVQKAAGQVKKASKPKSKTQPVTPVATTPDLVPERAAAEAARTGAARDANIQNKVYSTPAGFSSVGRNEITTFGSVDLGDVLRTVPGTSVRESPNNPGIGINIRGFEGSGRVNMMIDGVRQNFRFSGHEAQGFVYVDPLLLAGVDIARGAVSTAGGAGALAGAANFRTLDIIDVLRPGQSVGATTITSYGTNSQGWTGMAAGAVSSGNVGFIGAISGRNPGDFENGASITVPYTGQDLRSGLVKGEVLLTQEQKVKVNGVFYRNDFVANSYDQTLTSDIFSVNYHYLPIGTELVNFKLNAYRSDVTMEYKAPYTTAPTFPPLTSAGRVINDIGTGFDLTNVSLMRFGDLKVRAEYGYEYFQDDVTVINSTLQPGFGVNPSGESSISGIFSATTFSYGSFDLIAGLRYDRYTIAGVAGVVAGNPLGLPPGSFTLDRSEGRFNPKVTLAAKPADWFQPYVSYSESMRAPTVNETLAGGNHPGGGPRQGFFPNPFLEPEIQKGWEFGFNTAVDRVFTHKDFFRFKAAYFTQDIENYITATLTPLGQVYFINTPGTSRVQGVELQGMYDSGFFFAGMSYTWSDTSLPSQINGFGAQSYLPDHVISASAGVRLLDERWTLGARGYHASDAYVGVINNPTDPYTDGYTLLDLFTNYKLTPDIELGATMTNVFDVAFTPATSTPATGGFTGDTGRGRTTLFTVRAKF